MRKRHIQANFLRREVRPLVFGVEDSLISTLGVVTGMASGTESQATILLAGFVLISVEALSMAAGEMISCRAELEVDNLFDSPQPIVNAFVMGISYIVAGVIPLFPYALLSPKAALPVSLFAASVAIFSLGVWKESLIYRRHRSPIFGGIELFLISATVAAIGFFIGRLFGTGLQ